MSSEEDMSKDMSKEIHGVSVTLIYCTVFTIKHPKADCKNKNKKNKNIFISINNNIANLYIEKNYTNS